MWSIISPLKTNTPLVINANTILSLAITGQGLETITWQSHQGFKQAALFVCL
jgi:hypothetical protein